MFSYQNMMFTDINNRSRCDQIIVGLKYYLKCCVLEIEEHLSNILASITISAGAGVCVRVKT